jgi:acyl carrier protein
MDQDLFNRFVKCAVDTLSVEAAKVVPDARFKEDLEADSLDVVELMMAIEEEFGIEQIPEEELAEVTTVGQAFAIIASKL